MLAFQTLQWIHSMVAFDHYNVCIGKKKLGISPLKQSCSVDWLGGSGLNGVRKNWYEMKSLPFKAFLSWRKKAGEIENLNIEAWQLTRTCEENEMLNLTGQACQCEHILFCSLQLADWHKLVCVMRKGMTPLLLYRVYALCYGPTIEAAKDK